MSKAWLVGMLVLALAACARAAGNETTRLLANRVSPRSLVAGTLIQAKIRDSISSRRNTAGEYLTATVSEDVKNPRGQVVIPGGSTVGLRITALEPASAKRRPEGRIRLDVTFLTIRGQNYPVSGRIDSPPHELRGGATARKRDIVMKSGTPILFPIEQVLTVGAE